MGSPVPFYFEPHDLDVLADAHERIGSEVRSACEPEPAVLAASGAYGAAGASFTVAHNAYLTRMKASGDQLGQRYADQGAGIRAAAKQLSAIDAQNAAQIPRPR